MHNFLNVLRKLTKVCGAAFKVTLGLMRAGRALEPLHTAEQLLPNLDALTCPVGSLFWGVSEIPFDKIVEVPLPSFLPHSDQVHVRQAV